MLRCAPRSDLPNCKQAEACPPTPSFQAESYILRFVAKVESLNIPSYLTTMVQISHEYINSIGVAVAIALAVSGLVSSEGAIAIASYGVGWSDEKAQIHKEGGRLSIITHHSGYFDLLNGTSETAYVSIEVKAADDCPFGEELAWNDYYGPGLEQRSGVYTYDPEGYDSWARTKIEPSELERVPWEVSVARDPSIDGALCANIRTILADGSSYSLVYRVGFFSNIFNQASRSGQVIDAFDLIDDAELTFAEGEDAISADELINLTMVGDDQSNVFISDLREYRYYVVPRRICFQGFGVELCHVGQFRE
ncbi:hypothetical protein [Rhodovulum viride]|uniref:hypothetical protein n=1 Tax=Rhodovulum viride TaxID=1231134 RepID=UPI0011BEA68B|nr:hypothetical protein [Rhodovulum viride]